MDAHRHRLESLVRTCGRRAWSVAWALLRDGHEAHDAVQQAFLVAARKADRIPHDDPWPWFRVVVAHEARNLRRKRRPLASGSLLETDPAMTPREPSATDPSLLSERRDDARHVQASMDTLPAAERDAVALVHLAGMSHATAAQALGVPRQTVSARVQRGMDGLGRELGRPPTSVAGSLALLPIAAPPTGWESALAGWTQSALTALGTTTTAVGTTTAATTALGGLTFMSSKTLLAVSLTAAVGLGFLGGHVATNHHFDGGPGASTADVALAPQDAEAFGPGPSSLPNPSLDPGSGRLGAEMERLHRDNAELRRKLAEVTTQNEGLQKRLAAHPASQGPTFTFGKAGALPAIREANWSEMAQSSMIVGSSVHKILARKEAGEAVPKEVYLALQENVERMRKFEYRTIGKMPTAAKHNGEFTHPITIANLVAATLASAGQPLRDPQVARIEALGLRFEREFAAQRDRHPAGTPRVARMLAEYRLKGRFTADLAEVLDAEQRAVVYDPATRGIAGLDLHDPTLMILHTSPVIAGANVDEIAGKLFDLLARKLDLDDAAARALERPLDAWRADVRSLLVAVPVSRLKHYTYDQGEIAGEATVRLVTRLLGELELGTEVRQALLGDVAIYVPRIVAKTG
ncbi:MAG: sigma-70 family RNA polymerase sigma factor [Planctomycetota bacterium]|nr:sigma-70 family RNA polymerase sigma factor [Planctomycetota bacterium]